MLSDIHPRKKESTTQADLAWERLMALFKILLIGYFFIFMWMKLRVHFLGDHFPINSFFFDPATKYSDFTEMVVLCSTLNPYNANFGTPYPPFACALYYLFSLGHVSWVYFIYIIVPIIMIFPICYALIVKSGNVKSSIPIVFIYYFNYGILFSIDRGNFEIYTVAFLIIWSYLYDFSGNRYFWTRVLCLSAAIASKIYPTLLLLVLIKEKKWKELVCVGCTVVLMTFGSAIFFQGGALTALSNWTHAISIMQDAFSKDIQKVAYGLSLFGAFRTLLFLTMYQDISAIGAFLYDFFVITALFGLAFWVFKTEKVRWEIIGVIVCSYLLLPQVSGNYKLFHLILLVPALIFSESDPRRSQRRITILGLLLIPKNYLLVIMWINIDSLLNPFLLLILAMDFIAPNLVDRMTRTSDHGAVALSI